MKKLGITMLVVPLVLLAAACGGGDDGPPPKPVYPDFIDISADLTLSGANYVRGNLSECAGAGAYADVVKGAPVLVSNKVGKPLVVGAIAYGVGTNVYRNRLDQCTFRLRVPHTPRAMTYQLTIGRQKPIAVSFLGLVRSRGTASFALPPRTAATTTTTPLPAFAPEPAG